MGSKNNHIDHLFFYKNSVMNTCPLFIIYLLFHLTHAHGGALTGEIVTHLTQGWPYNVWKKSTKQSHTLNPEILFYLRGIQIKTIWFSFSASIRGPDCSEGNIQDMCPWNSNRPPKSGSYPTISRTCTRGQCLRNTLWWWQNYMTLQNCLLYGKTTCHISNSEDNKH